LKDEVDRYRDRNYAIDQFTLRRAQIEVKAAILFGKTRQAIKVVDLLGGQDRQATGVGGHARATFSECKKLHFSHCRMEMSLHGSGRPVSSA
jgi:hypothetical protein